MKTAFAFLVVVALFAYVSAQAVTEPNQATTPAPAGSPTTAAAAPTENPETPPAEDAPQPKMLENMIGTGEAIAQGLNSFGFGFMKKAAGAVPFFGK